MSAWRGTGSVMPTSMHARRDAAALEAAGEHERVAAVAVGAEQLGVDERDVDRRSQPRRSSSRESDRKFV